MVGEYIDDGWSGTTFERLNFKRMMVQVKSILKDETYIGNKVIVNYRPILIAGQLEASYPSSTTMLAICVLSTAVMQLRERLVRPVLRRWGGRTAWAGLFYGHRATAFGGSLVERHCWRCAAQRRTGPALCRDQQKLKLEKLFMLKDHEELYLYMEDTQWPLEYIDHDRVIARAIVFDDEGYFYFLRVEREDDFGSGSFIETAGGGVEPGEVLEKAIVRELWEELGAQVEVLGRIGVVSDYYNLIHRHNINNYYLCRAISFGERHLTQMEREEIRLSTRRMTFAEAVSTYTECACLKWGRLLADRELPILHAAKSILDRQNRR